jgi:O-antigen ligase
MYDVYRFGSVKDISSHQRTQRNLVLMFLLLLLLAVSGSMGAIAYFAPQHIGPMMYLVGLVTFVLLIYPVLIWKYPLFGVYSLVAGTILFGGAPDQGKITVPTYYVGFWWNLSTAIPYYTGANAFDALVFSAAEILVFLACLTWLIRTVVDREFRLELGPFIYCLGGYAAFVFLAYLYGISSGGNNTMALYEVRPQALFAILYLMAANMFKEKRQVTILLWIIVVGIGLMSICGVITFVANKFVVAEHGVLTHDDSIELNMIIFMVMIGLLGRMNKHLTVASLCFLPFAIVSQLANNRRAGIAAFIIAFIPLLPLMWTAIKPRRKQIALFATIFSFGAAIYLPLAWNAQGAWALPARAIRSQSSPDARDAGSDYYRLAENGNLKATRDARPWLGYGYGKPMMMVYAMPYVATGGFTNYMTHNSVLWVWMRTGNLGFFCFLMFYAVVLIRGTQHVKEVDDPILRTAGIMAILHMLMMFTYGKYDMQFVNPRQMAFLGCMAGVLAILPKLYKPQEDDALLVRPQRKTPEAITASDW